MTAISRLIWIKPFSSEFGVLASYKYLAKLSWRRPLIATINQIPAPLNIPHALTAGELLVRTGVSIPNGLTDDEVSRRRTIFRRNTIAEHVAYVAPHNFVGVTSLKWTGAFRQLEKTCKTAGENER